MKFDVIVHTEPRRADTIPTEEDWPTMPFEPDGKLVPNLTVWFFDGSTRPDTSETTGFSVMPCYDGNPALLYAGQSYQTPADIHDRWAPNFRCRQVESHPETK